MTDDRAGNPRFAFIPKRAWDLLLDLAPIPLGGIALWFSVLFIACLVQDYSWTTAKLGPISSAFVPNPKRGEMEDPMPAVIAVGSCLYFLLDIQLRRREKVGALNREGFGRSRLLLASATIVIALLAAFWYLDAKVVHWLAPWEPYEGEWYATCSIILGGAWALAGGTALVLCRMGRRFEAICLLPPIACLAATLLNAIACHTLHDAAVFIAALLPGGLLSITTIHGRLVLVTVCITACVLPAGLCAERRLFHSSQRAIGIACASLWALAAAMASWVLQSEMPMAGLISWRGPEISLEPHFVLAIAGAFVFAACIRVLVFFRRRAAMHSDAERL